ncbi:MAG: pseudouridine synthase [Bdellovibrionota bacterium]
MANSFLDFLYNDEYLFAIKKPANIHSVINKNSQNVSIAEKLLEAYPALSVVSKREDAGLLNRLDFETSGILFGAWKSEYYKTFRTNINSDINSDNNNSVEKTYVAICEGKVEGVVLETYVGGAYRGSKKVRIYALGKNPKRALIGKSNIELVSFNKEKDLSLVSIKVFEARRHQIRAHLSYLGTPLLGDALYGAKRNVLDYFKISKAPKFLLHNENLTLRNPFTKKLIKIACECEWEKEFFKV